MHYGSVLVTVLGVDGFLDAGGDIRNADDGMKASSAPHRRRCDRPWSRRKKLRGRRNIEADGLREDGGVAADEVAIDGGVRATGAFALRENEGFLCERFDLRGVKLDSASGLHFSDQLVGD